MPTAKKKRKTVAKKRVPKRDHRPPTPDEMITPQVAAFIGTIRQRILIRHNRHPEKLRGRIWWPLESGNGTGLPPKVYCWNKADVYAWAEELAEKAEARKALAKKKAEVRALHHMLRGR
jgi:hypothetical protein